MLRESQLLTEPVTLDLCHGSKSKDVAQFIDSDNDSINKLLENIDSPMFFFTELKGSQSIISLRSKNQPDCLYFVDVDNFQP